MFTHLGVSKADRHTCPSNRWFIIGEVSYYSYSKRENVQMDICSSMQNMKL